MFVYAGFMAAAIDTVKAATAALAAVDDAAVGGLDDADLERLVEAAAALRVAVDRLWLRLAAGAERRELHQRHHQRDAASWLAQVSGERPGVTRRDVELASALAAAPVVAEAAAERGLSRAKTAELVRAATLPEEVVEQLADAATGQTVDQLASAVRQARLNHEVPDVPLRPSCQVTRRGDHVEIAAVVDVVGGECVEVALDAYAETAKLPRDLPYRERRAAALVGLARFWLDHVADPALTRVGRPHVLVLVPLETLEARVGGTATLGSGAVIAGEAARRLAVDANVTRIVTKGASQVLDVGRTTRTIPPHLAKAVIARDRHCRYEGCTAPPWACEIHHRVPWSQGGITALDVLGCLCWFHHQEVHRRGPANLVETPGGRWRLAPPRAVAA